MCGIYGILNASIIKKYVNEIMDAFEKNNMRGPDNTQYAFDYERNVFLGFHRLSINGLDNESNQPLIVNKKILICNGEIYNYQEFYKQFNITPKTHSDCESIIYMYEQFGIEGALQYMDGVYAFVLIDYSDPEDMKAFVARDPFGVRSLFSAKCESEDASYDSFIFASEMKYFYDLNYTTPLRVNNITQFTPGTYTELFSAKFYESEGEIWDLKPGRINVPYFNVKTIMDTPIHVEQQHLECVDGYSYFGVEEMEDGFQGLHGIHTEKQVLNGIRQTLEDAVLKRVTTTDRPVACLLSGGLDSSLITSLVHRFYSKQGKQLETYSIGMEGGEDLKYAQMVADFLGTKHTTITLTEEDFLNAIPEVCKITETYDTTTIRASVGNYLVSKYISEHSDAKVIFNGDGSDEVTGGYMYFHCAPSDVHFDVECKRLLSEIHFYDVLRSDRSISNAGLEARTPFLDKRFVQTYLNIPKEIRFDTHKKHCEKYLLRKAFDDGTYLPREVLWRTKEAFSDGVSSQKRSWFQIIQEHVERENVLCELTEDELSEMKHILSMKNVNTSGNETTEITNEQLYYFYLFNKNYNDQYHNNEEIIPYYWMPRFINATDASARTLNIYSDKMKSVQDG